MEKLDEINLVINEYNDLLTEIADRKNNLRTAKFISSKRIEAINSRNEEIQLKNRENKRLLNEEYSKLEIELENKLKDLDERKERDIKEYLSSDFIKDLNFYDGYIKNLKDRFEKEYDKKKEALKEEFKAKTIDLAYKFAESEEDLLDPQSEIDRLKKLNEIPDFKNVDARQIIDLKLKNIKKLTLLKLELEKDDLEVNKSKELLNKIEELLKFMQLTTDENKILMTSMTEKEEIEYKLRTLKSELREQSKALKQKEEISNTECKNESISEDEPELETDFDDSIFIEPENTMPKQQKETMDSDFISENDVITTKNRSSLLKLIYNSLIDNSKNLSSIKLDYHDNRHAIVNLRKSQQDDYEKQENILDLTNTIVELTEGEYLNKQKIIDSLKMLAINYKYTTFLSKDPKKEYIVSSKNINKLISKLEKITTLELIKYVPNHYIIYGKQDGKSSYIMDTDYNMDLMAGEYISKDELIYELNNVITNKKIEKLKNISKKLKSLFNNKKTYRSKYHALNDAYVENQIELDEDFVIKKK